MTFVIPFKDGNLYCIDCGEKVANTANHEMRREGFVSYSHTCPKNEEIREKLRRILDGK